MKTVLFRDLIKDDVSFLGKNSQDLGNLIGIQMKSVFEAEKIVIPVKSCSIVFMLGHFKEASVVELALSLEQSHQLVKQKVPKLIDLGLIGQKDDPNDGRRKVFFLTGKGRSQLKKFQAFREIASQLVGDLSKEIESSLFQVISEAISALNKKELLQRYLELKS